MKLTIVALLSLPLMGIAQIEQNANLDLLSICMDKPMKQPFIIIDNGFCDHYLEKESEFQVKEIFLQADKGIKLNPQSCLDSKNQELPQIAKSPDKWKVRFYASHSYTTYFNSDVTFKSTRYNVEIKDYEWAERSSREFFSPKTWKKPGNNPFQMIDEPSNTFVVSIEKDGNEFFLSAFHPKFLQSGNQVKNMKGTIDGVAVDGVYDVNKQFDGYNQTSGESELVGNFNTHKQMTFEAGWGHRFKLIDTKFGSVTYIPSLAAGVMVGENGTIMIKEGQWWDYDYYNDNYGVQGFGGSITNRVEINSPKERFGMFYENKLSMYRQDHGFLDGTQKYNLGFMGNSFGMKFMIHNPKNHAKKVPKD